jgi:hypothetical protein
MSRIQIFRINYFLRGTSYNCSTNALVLRAPHVSQLGKLALDTPGDTGVEPGRSCRGQEEPHCLGEAMRRCEQHCPVGFSEVSCVLICVLLISVFYKNRQLKTNIFKSLLKQSATNRKAVVTMRSVYVLGGINNFGMALACQQPLSCDYQVL